MPPERHALCTFWLGWIPLTSFDHHASSHTLTHPDTSHCTGGGITLMIKHSTIQYCTCLGIPVGHTGHTSKPNTFKIWPTQLYNAWYTNSHPCAYVFGPHCFCACKCQRRVPKSNFQTSASEKRAGISKKNKNVARCARHNTSPTYCTRYIDASFNPSRKRNLKPCWWELPCSTISLGQPMISDLRPLHLHWKLLSDKIFFRMGRAEVCWECPASIRQRLQLRSKLLS